jgi:curved DNA-binding protein CbpA
MTDAFQLLQVPRRPWIDLGELKERFVRLSSEVHPDRTHNDSTVDQAGANDRYAEVNAAYTKLKDFRERLLHLMELELGERPKDIQRIPPGTMDLFVEVGQTCRDCDAFLTRKSSSDSPMFRLQMMREGFAWTDKLSALQSGIESRRVDLENELKALNEVWDAAPCVGSPTRRAALPLERLEQIYRVASYISRWTEQIQERVVQLAV